MPGNALVSDRDMKVAEFINSIKNSPEWLEKVKQKAIEKHIPLDSMILLDALLQNSMGLNGMLSTKPTKPTLVNFVGFVGFTGVIVLLI